MILQSLVGLYESLAAKGALERPGWSGAKVSWALEIDDDGQLMFLVPLEKTEQRGKKTVTVPETMNVPMPVKRTVGVAANFLCDNASYMLGADNKGKPERSRACFEACRALHHRLLDGIDDPTAIAVLRFLDAWEPERAAEHPALKPHLEEVLKGGNLVLRCRYRFAHEVAALKEAWNAYYQNDDDAVVMQCLVTGEKRPIELLHPNIKGVLGAQSSGASLVSFNAPSLESYGCDGSQGLNAPVSKYAAFAYGAALNYLLGSRDHHLRIGDTTVVFWAEESDAAEDGCASFLSDILSDDNSIDRETLRDAMKNIAAGKRDFWQNLPLNPDNRFYILGLAPNAARLSVRFYMSDTFGRLMRNVLKHQADLDVVKPEYDKHNELSVWWLLNETVNQNSRDKTPHPQMAGDVTRAILMGGAYPATLYDQVQIRIRAEREMTRGRAAIIKAYLLRLPDDPYKEVLTVNLNEETMYQPYLLGRLFSVLEELQEKANPGINTTIRDRYFSSACATPAMVFPTLIRLAQAHLKKLDGGLKIHYDKMLTALLGRITEAYLARLSLHDQGVFQLGYYHQTQKRYEKKEDTKNV